MQMRNLAAMAAIIVATSPCLAGGSPGYYQAPYYAEQPPVVVYTTPPNPIVGIVGGVVSLPFVVLGGIATAIAPPAIVSCVAPDGYFFPCAGPTPWPGYGPQEPYPSPPATPPRPLYGPHVPPSRHSGGGGCYGPDGAWQGDGNGECVN
jgi:hypothetical protein